MLVIQSCSLTNCWPWAALSPASSRACFHMFPLHDYTHPTRGDSDLSCRELVTPNSSQHEIGWERCVCWLGAGGGNGRGGIEKERKGGGRGEGKTGGEKRGVEGRDTKRT